MKSMASSPRRTAFLALAVALAAAGCVRLLGTVRDADGVGVAQAAAPDPLDDDYGLAAAQARVDASFDGADYDKEQYELVIDSSAEAAQVTAPCTFDVQWGNGHGGDLEFVRFSVGAEMTTVEQVTYVTEWPGRRSGQCAARRARVPTSDIAPLLHLARAEARTTAELRLRPDADPGAGHWWSSNDFFVLTRVVAGERRLLESEFCGYSSGDNVPFSVGPRLVVDAVRAHLDGVASWLPCNDLRATHWSDAVDANAAVMLRDAHWWVMERSVEALGAFGTPVALPALRRLDSEYQDPRPRQRAKIRNVLARPDHYLAGEPKRVPETLDAVVASRPDK